jgi:hypothetical protein
MGYGLWAMGYGQKVQRYNALSFIKWVKGFIVG